MLTNADAKEDADAQPNTTTDTNVTADSYLPVLYIVNFLTTKKQTT